MREQLKTKLEEQAEWRRCKAVEYPEDHRNIEAAELLDRLAATFADVPQHLLDAYQAAFRRHDTMSVVQNEEMALREVGFRTFPQNAAEFIETFLEMNAYLERRDPFQPRAV